ncbi:hypothetical protein KHA80_14190 [Anaerobacillus sp. HL2]|nr:hypothetical protein KHA80_14190 [Anaerobacillus sp. HL2]
MSRKRKPKWFLLFRREDEQAVYCYEPLKKYELQSRLKKGWKVIQMSKAVEKIKAEMEKENNPYVQVIGQFLLNQALRIILGMQKS